MAGKQQDESTEEAVFVPFQWLWQFCGSMFVMWLVSVAIHIGWVRWHELDPASHMESLIAYYVDQTGGSPLVEKMADQAYWLVFEATRAQRSLLLAPTVQPGGRGANENTNRDLHVSGAIKRSFWGAFRPDLQVAGYATVLFGLKLGMLLVATLLFGLLLVAAGVDGFVQRDIRRACGGHESASMYHRAKKFSLRLLQPFAAVVFFCSPWAFDPGWLFVPTAIISAVLLRVQVTYYKKYW